MKHSIAFAAAAAASLATASPAQAATLFYELTGDYNASWYLDSNPVPDDSDGDGVNFIIWDVAGFPDAFFGVADLTFWHDDLSGGLTIDDIYGGSTLFDAIGPQLYSGSEADPTLLTGVFALDGINDFQGGSYLLTVTAVVPEPATWAVLVLGFGAIGGAMRSARRKPNVRVTFA